MCQLKLNEDSPGKLTQTFLSEVSCLTNFNKIQLKQLGWIDAGSVIVRSFYNSKLNRWFSVLFQKGKFSVVKKDLTDKGTLEEPLPDFLYVWPPLLCEGFQRAFSEVVKNLLNKE